jgi:hypothetical protein
VPDLRKQQHDDDYDHHGNDDHDDGCPWQARV